jgi:hypothetical protein
MSQLVWYASYGSNLSHERFTCYIRGGQPPGSTRCYPGCVDPSLPRDVRVLELAQSLYFAGSSKAWTGGIAFISSTARNMPTKARAYLISLEQFQDVVRQENWLDERAQFSLTELIHKGSLRLSDIGRNYQLLLLCGDADGIPVVTLTSPIERTDIAPPAPAYVRMIGSGLMEAHGLSAQSAAEYLLRVPGMAPAYTAGAVADLLQPVAITP